MGIKFSIVAALALAASAPARAQDSGAAAQPSPEREGEAPAKGGAKPAEAGSSEPATKEEVQALAEEIRRLKLELGLRDLEYRSYGGLGPAASKVYFAPKGLSIGGYGELVYRNELDVDGADQSDLYRVVLYTGYRFNDWIVFNSEVEFEHHDELSVEFAYLDFLFTRALQLRIGNVLVPVGIVNEKHEPPFFNGVFRPVLERNLIPSTWNENGLGLHGEAAGLRYQAYLLTGLYAFSGDMQASTWIRGARTGGGESPSETFAGVAALEYALGPASVGGSFYGGRADQNVKAGATGEPIEVTVTLAEVHASAEWRGLFAKAMAAVGRLGGAAELSAELGLSGADVLGSEVRGAYLELAYDVLALLAPGGEASLSPFARVEVLDLHHEVPDGGTRDPALDQRYLTAGLTFKPISTVALKADFTRRDAEGTPALDSVNLGVGFAF
jgi:hypothetical protein